MVRIVSFSLLLVVFLLSSTSLGSASRLSECNDRCYKDWQYQTGKCMKDPSCVQRAMDTRGKCQKDCDWLLKKK